MNPSEWSDRESWWILPETLNAMRAEVERGAVKRPPDGPQNVAAVAGTKAEGSRRTEMRPGGVAVIPVCGPITRYSNWFSEYFGGTSTASIALDVSSAAENPAVRSILLSVDSPGGSASGATECAALIRKAAQSKPLEVYSGGACCSLAYLFASAASRITVDPTSVVGSIGTVAWVDTRKTAGVETMRSSQTPLKALEPGSDEGRAALQKLLDANTTEFVARVAEYRGVTPAKVLRDFGKGGTMLGRDAVKFGLADRLGSFEETVARLAAGKGRNRVSMSNRAAGPQSQGNANVNPFMKMLGKIYETNPDVVESAMQEDGDGQRPFYVVPQRAAAQAPAPVFDAAAERAKIEASVKAENLVSHNAALASLYGKAADAFFESVADRTEPAAVPGLTALYVDLAMSDHASPLSVGGKPFSRLNHFTAGVSGVAKHDRGTQSIPVDATTAAGKLAGFKLLGDAATSADAAAVAAKDDAMIREMLGADADKLKV